MFPHISPILTHLTVAVAAFGMGVAVGLFVCDGPLGKRRVRRSIALAVTTVWVLSVGAEILVSGYSTSFLVHGIMGSVTGFLLSEDGLDITIGNAQ
jgi:hypothetical protein